MIVQNEAFPELEMEFLNLAEGTYAALDLATIQRIYLDLHRLVEQSIADGSEIIQAIDALYQQG